MNFETSTSHVESSVLNAASHAHNVQRKLSIGAVNDPLEAEADTMADTVMRMPEPTFIQRKCSHCEEEEKAQRKPLMSFIQKKEADGKSVANDAISNQIQSTKGSGRPINESTKSFMESRFGTDFSDVNVHTGSYASQLSSQLNAQAFTVGNDIYFNDGKYAPDSNEGKRLLAHELTHVVQQTPNISAKKIQRLVRTSLVTCPVGQNPFAADRHASALLANAVALINSAVAARPSNPAHPDVITVGNAMHTAFRLNAANNSNWVDPAPHFGIPLIRRRVDAVRNYIDSVVFTVTCGAAGANVPLGTCGTVPCNGPEAWSCHSDATQMVLCPPFWALNANQRARTFMHEVFHITFRSIDDWASPDSDNAHCYAQFVALLNGFNSPAGFTCH